MPLILETPDFIIKAHDNPHHDRNNGGHVVVTPKKVYGHMYQMPVEEMNKLMHLVALTEQAVTSAMKTQGIEIIRANIQINGNWAYKVQRQYV